MAGSRTGQEDRVAEAAGVSCKAFAEIAGEAMIERVIAAVRLSQFGDRIIVSMPENLPHDLEAPGLSKALREHTVDQTEAAGSPVQSLLNILPRLVDDTPFLVTTADHALLSAAMINTFLRQFDSKQFDVAAAMLPLERLTRKYPDQRRTRLKFLGVGYKGCNLFVFRDKAVAKRVLLFWRHIETHRKKPWKMIWALGPLTLIRYLTGSLSLPAAVRILGKRTSTRLQTVMLDFPEAAIDVDTPEDLEFARMIAQQEAR